MSIIDSIKSLFGEGKIRFLVDYKDGSAQYVKVKYVGSLATLDDESRADITNRIEVESGKRVRKITMVGAY
jgi:hypothetical protein